MITKVPLIALACSGATQCYTELLLRRRSRDDSEVNGVAIATVISNALEASLILFIRLIRTDKYIKLEPRSLRIDGQSMKLILKIGLPAGIQSAVFSLSNIVIQSAINSLGKVVMAASSAALNIELLAYYVLQLPSVRRARPFRSVRTTARVRSTAAAKRLLLSILEDFIASAIAIGIVLLSGRFLLSIFNSDPEVIEIGYTRLIYLFSAYVFSMLYEVLSGYMRRLRNLAHTRHSHDHRRNAVYAYSG